MVMSEPQVMQTLKGRRVKVASRFGTQNAFEWINYAAPGVATFDLLLHLVCGVALRCSQV